MSDTVVRVVVEPHYDDDPDRPDARVGMASCVRCLSELQAGMSEEGIPVGVASPESYARQQFGVTDDGWQVWCVRHQCNIVHISVNVKPQKES